MVQQAMGYIDSTPDKASKVELIKTLSNISAGKVLYNPLLYGAVQFCTVHHCSTVLCNPTSTYSVFDQYTDISQREFVQMHWMVLLAVCRVGVPDVCGGGVRGR